MIEPTVVVSDTAGIVLTDVSTMAILPSEAVSCHRRGKRGTCTGRKREARTRMIKHPIRYHRGDDER